MKMIIVGLLCLCLVGCYVGANPVGDEGHILKITNKTFGAKEIVVQVRGDFLYKGKSYNLVEKTLGYFDEMRVDVRVNEWCRLSYIVPLYQSGQYKYKLVYEEDVYLYPENELVEIVTPESIHDYKWMPH